MSVDTQSQTDLFFTKNSLKTKAKWYVRKNPGIYMGNLTFRLQEDIPTATNNEITLAYLQLMKEGFFFDRSNCVYPPGKINTKEKAFSKLIEEYELEEIDLEIFLTLDDLGKSADIKSVARKVVSLNSDYEESYVKYRIAFLFTNKFIFANQSHEITYLAVNRRLLDGEIE